MAMHAIGWLLWDGGLFVLAPTLAEADYERVGPRAKIAPVGLQQAPTELAEVTPVSDFNPSLQGGDDGGGGTNKHVEGGAMIEDDIVEEDVSSVADSGDEG